MTENHDAIVTDAKTEDHYFLGFPSYWNVVAFYAVVLDLPPAGVAVVRTTARHPYLRRWLEHSTALSDSRSRSRPGARRARAAARVTSVSTSTRHRDRRPSCSFETP